MSIEEFIDLFEDGRNRYYFDPVFKITINGLYRNRQWTPLFKEFYLPLLDQLLQSRYNLEKDNHSLRGVINTGVMTQYIVGTQESIDKLIRNEEFKIIDRISKNNNLVNVAKVDK